MVSFSTENGVILSNHLNMFMQPGFNIKRIAIQTVEFSLLAKQSDKSI